MLTRTEKTNCKLFFDNKFVIRPVPDKAYAVQVVAMQRPTELLTGSVSPEVASWWQYIAYGAAIKIFEDRTDLESKERHMPEFYRQKMFEGDDKLVNSKKCQQ